MKTKDKALEHLRKLCLSFPETSEADSWGHPNFRAGKTTFVTYEWIKGRPSIAFRLDSDEVDQLLVFHSDCFVTPYGKGKWVSIWADGRLDWQMLRDLIERSYRKVALKRMIVALEASKA